MIAIVLMIVCLLLPFVIGLIAVETTVCILIELMWIIITQYPDSLSSCVPHFVKFLTSTVSSIY